MERKDLAQLSSRAAIKQPDHTDDRRAVFCGARKRRSRLSNPPDESEPEGRDKPPGERKNPDGIKMARPQWA
jgi:hypothetical protein